MEFIKIQDEYTWVVKVLDSCLTVTQISTSEKLFRQFLGKWKNGIPDERRDRLINNFGKLIKSKTIEVRKK